jgi:glucose-1-phosphate thymidylyltransferase
MKGIVLAGGSGTRLHPVTVAVSKQLLPLYDKPMIYYPLSALMLAGIQDILIISTPIDQPAFQRLLGDGSQWGMSFSYAAQPSPDGLAQAFIIGREFIGNDRVALALGDNIFFGHGFPEVIRRASERDSGATVFGYRVRDPERYGVVEFDAGLYFYDNQVVDIAADLKPSPRGELEITDVNSQYLAQGSLSVELLGRGVAWLDTGTHESLLQAANFIQTIQERQGLMVACLEEIAYQQGLISVDKLESLIAAMRNSSYATYLKNLVSAR